MSRDELRVLIREVIAEVVEDMTHEIVAVAGNAQELKPPSNSESMPWARGVLTEKQLQKAAANKVAVVRVEKSVIITPLAKDAARSKGIRIERID